ncbi:MAG: hypothetical protein JOZ01_01560, partial [Candidatus Eremiobacteraeota bacterium]|nr:hypothetical protein [Candidatus Eremiobacteraeota bacterium]
YHEHGRGAYVSDNKPYGALLTLYLARTPPSMGKKKPSAHVQVLDAGGQMVDAFDVPVHAGLNRFTWDLGTLPPSGARTVQDARPYYVFYPMTIAGPEVLPGTYTVEITALGRATQAPVTVRLDPHDDATREQLQAQYAALMELAGLQERAEVAIAHLERVRKALASVPSGRSAQTLAARQAADKAAAALLDELRNPEPSGYRQAARLSEQVAYLRLTVAQFDGPPTSAQTSLAQAYGAAMNGVETRERSLDATIAGLNERLRAENVRTIEP